jgi:tetratricopeptide (TPR) repeat protein
VLRLRFRKSHLRSRWARNGELAVLLALLAGSSAYGAEPVPPPVAPLVGPAAPPPDGEVDPHVALGHRLSELGRYEDAVGEFRRAYELSADPRLLYEIAATYRRLGAADQALFYFERYLASAPGAPDRAQVEAQVAALKKAHRAAHPRPHMIVEEAPPPPPPRIWRRWWFWAALGVVAGATATGIALSRHSTTEVPPTALGDQKFFQ